jgi:hypothetical protein
MYKIIGANQAEYGPVSVEQLRQWIAEGRINAQTPAQAAGETGWKPISTFPEFAASFPSAAAPPPPLGAPSAPSPFASPAGRPGALNAVNGPAIGLMVVAILSIAYSGFSIIWNAFGVPFANLNAMEGMNLPAQNVEVMRALQSMSGTMGIVIGVIQIALAAFVFYGGLKMKALQQHTLCIVASIVSIIPCNCPCCCIGIPIGIWALIVLNKPEVRDYFS